MKLNRILLALLCLFAGASIGFAQDIPAVCYVYRIGEINVVLYYDAEHREPFDVHLEYPENFTDTLFCTNSRVNRPIALPLSRLALRRPLSS